jgi:hypothetical protein
LSTSEKQPWKKFSKRINCWWWVSSLNQSAPQKEKDLKKENPKKKKRNLGLFLSLPNEQNSPVTS